jgi:hypothetical protein
MSLAVAVCEHALPRNMKSPPVAQPLSWLPRLHCNTAVTAEFIRELTAAIYVEHAADRVLVEEALQAACKSLSEAEFSTSWRNQRIRRQIKEGATTQAAVLSVLQKFRGMICPCQQQPVVNEAVEEVFQNQALASISINGKLYSTFDLMAGKVCKHATMSLAHACGRTACSRQPTRQLDGGLATAGSACDGGLARLLACLY